MSAIGFWSFRPLFEHPGLFSVSVISEAGGSSLEIPFSSEPDISSSSLWFMGSKERLQEFMLHLPDPKEDNVDEKVTMWMRIALEAVNEPLPIRPVSAVREVTKAGKRLNFLTGALQDDGLSQQMLPQFLGLSAILFKNSRHFNKNHLATEILITTDR